ncbi:hypothetical protein J6590_080327 [Homalodisca vitripennis]|nr:hypothetical protein J6590_080327 [Homalodisca vitripennis]
MSKRGVRPRPPPVSATSRPRGWGSICPRSAGHYRGLPVSYKLALKGSEPGQEEPVEQEMWAERVFRALGNRYGVRETPDKGRPIKVVEKKVIIYAEVFSAKSYRLLN